MNEVQSRVATRLGISTFRCDALIPSEATSIRSPVGFVEIEIILRVVRTHIHIDILAQIAV